LRVPASGAPPAGAGAFRAGARCEAGIIAVGGALTAGV
jgi:hypothetical protein